MSVGQLNMPVSDEANAVLSNDPFALLIAMVLDQQIPLERAFAAPIELRTRLDGTLHVRQIAEFDPEQLAEIFSRTPALHRFPVANAKRVQKLAQLIVDNYAGDASAIWTSATDGTVLLTNIKALPGFGEQKAKIFIALLGKQLGIRPKGWRKACEPFGEPRTKMSIADIHDSKSLAAVRSWKQARKIKAVPKQPTT